VAEITDRVTIGVLRFGGPPPGGGDTLSARPGSPSTGCPAATGRLCYPLGNPPIRSQSWTTALAATVRAPGSVVAIHVSTTRANAAPPEASALFTVAICINAISEGDGWESVSAAWHTDTTATVGPCVGLPPQAAKPLTNVPVRARRTENGLTTEASLPRLPGTSALPATTVGDQDALANGSRLTHSDVNCPGSDGDSGSLI